MGNLGFFPSTAHAETLEAATGDEVLLTLDYTVDKATSGADTGILIAKTDTASPGVSNFLEAKVGSTTFNSLGDDGHLHFFDGLEGNAAPITIQHMGSNVSEASDAHDVLTTLTRYNWSLLQTWNMDLDRGDIEWDVPDATKTAQAIELGLEGFSVHSTPVGETFQANNHVVFQIKAEGSTYFPDTIEGRPDQIVQPKTTLFLSNRQFYRETETGTEKSGNYQFPLDDSSYVLEDNPSDVINGAKRGNRPFAMFNDWLAFSEGVVFGSINNTNVPFTLSFKHGKAGTTSGSIAAPVFDADHPLQTSAPSSMRLENLFHDGTSYKQIAYIKDFYNPATGDFSWNFFSTDPGKTVDALNTADDTQVFQIYFNRASDIYTVRLMSIPEYATDSAADSDLPAYSLYTLTNERFVRLADQTSDDLSILGDFTAGSTDVSGISSADTLSADSLIELINTFTDASNYERLHVSWVSDELTFETQHAGTGNHRDTLFRANSANSFAYWAFRNTSTSGSPYARLCIDAKTFPQLHFRNETGGTIFGLIGYNGGDILHYNGATEIFRISGTTMTVQEPLVVNDDITATGDVGATKFAGSGEDLTWPSTSVLFSTENLWTESQFGKYSTTATEGVLDLDDGVAQKCTLTADRTFSTIGAVPTDAEGQYRLAVTPGAFTLTIPSSFQGDITFTQPSVTTFIVVFNILPDGSLLFAGVVGK